MKKIARSDKYADVRAAILIGSKEGIKDGLIEEERVKELCNKFSDFLGSDGLVKSTKKGEVSSLKETAQFLNILDLCVYRTHLTAQAREPILKTLETLVQSAKYVGDV